MKKQKEKLLGKDVYKRQHYTCAGSGRAMYITKNRRPATAEGEKYAAYQKYTYDRPGVRH